MSFLFVLISFLTRIKFSLKIVSYVMGCPFTLVWFGNHFFYQPFFFLCFLGLFENVYEEGEPIRCQMRVVQVRGDSPQTEDVGKASTVHIFSI